MQPYKSIGRLESNPQQSCLDSPPSPHPVIWQKISGGENPQQAESSGDFHVLSLSGQMEPRGNEPAASDGELQFTPHRWATTLLSNVKNKRKGRGFNPTVRSP